MSIPSFFKRYLTEITNAEFKTRYDLGPVIGSGAQADVHSAVQVETGRSVAVKKLTKSEVFSDYAEWACSPERVQAEIVIHSSLRHRNIAKFYEALMDEKYIYIMMELVEGDALANHMDDAENGLPVQSILSFMKQQLDVLHYLHSRGIAHGDFHRMNIMMDGDELKVIDFGKGTATNMEQRVERFCGGSSACASASSSGSSSRDFATDIKMCGRNLEEMLKSNVTYRRKKYSRQTGVKEPADDRRIRRILEKFENDILYGGEPFTIEGALETLRSLE